MRSEKGEKLPLLPRRRQPPKRPPQAKQRRGRGGSVCLGISGTPGNPPLPIASIASRSFYCISPPPEGRNYLSFREETASKATAEGRAATGQRWVRGAWVELLDLFLTTQPQKFYIHLSTASQKNKRNKDMTNKNGGIGIIPYRADLVERARKLRNNSTPAEKRLWKYISRKQIHGFDFDRQTPIDNYIVDFFCKELKLVIELDGMYHDLQVEYDHRRQNRIKSFEIKIIRFEEKQVIKNIDPVLDEIEYWVLEREKIMTGEK